MRRTRAGWPPGIIVAALLLSLLPSGPLSAATFITEFDVPSNAPNGVYTSVNLSSTKTYLAEATGTYSYGLLGGSEGRADVECSNAAGGPYIRNTFDAVQGPDVLDLLINGQAKEWAAAVPSPGLGCDDPLTGGSNKYSSIFSPAVTGIVNFRIRDVNHADNSGLVHVKIYEVTVPPAEPLLLPLGTTIVPSNSINNTFTVPLVTGVKYVLESTGTFTYNGGGNADTECSTSAIDPLYKPARYGLYNGEDWLDVLINDHAVTWVPVGEVDPGCSSTQHKYRYTIIPTVPGPVNLKVWDSYYGDNSGTITVTTYVAP